MSLNVFELVELRKLERGGLVGSDGRDWLRGLIGITVTAILAGGVGFLTQQPALVVTVAMLCIAATAMWTVRAGQTMVARRVADLRSRQSDGL